MTFRRLIATLLAVCMVASCVPGWAVTAHAEENHDHEHSVAETVSETVPETVPETIPETIPETVPETVPETEAAEEEPVATEIPEQQKDTVSGAQLESAVPASDTAVEIALDTETAVSITTGGSYAYFQFTPTTTDYYNFYSTGSYDTYGYIYDSEGSTLASNDDSGEGNNFSVSYLMEAGVTYTLGARLYSSSNTGSFSVTLRASHYYSSEVTTAPTCTEDGVRTYTCDYCGTSYTEAVAATHTFGDEVVTLAPTCTEMGETTITCTVCGYSESWETSALGHSFSDGLCGTCGLDQYYNLSVIALDTETTANVTFAGEYVYFEFTPEQTEQYTFCSTGSGNTYGYLYDADMNQLTYDNNSGDSYNFSISYVLEEGTTYYWAARYYSSSTLGSFTVLLTVSHDYTGEITTAPTCTEDGVQTYTCAYCDASYTEVVAAGHTFGDEVAEVEAACVTAGVTSITCTACGYKESWETSALGHSFSDGFCTRCSQDQYANWSAIALDTETEVTISYIGEYAYLEFTPDTTEMYTFCSIGDSNTYGYLYNYDEEGNLNQLAYDNNGGDGYNFSITAELQADTPYVFAARYYSSTATGSFGVMLTVSHNYVAEVTTEPTCTQPGEYTMTCRYCSASYTEPASALGHNWVNAVCSICGESLADSMDAIALDTATTVTITNAGETVYFFFTPEVTEYYSFFSECSYDTYGLIYDSSFNQLSGDDDGGTNVNFKVSYALEAGQTYILGARFLNSSATGSFDVKLQVSHSYALSSSVAYTCTEPGSNTYTCQYCSGGYTEEVPASHTYTDSTVCDVCGEDLLTTAAVLSLDSAVAGTVDSGEKAWFVFTPEATDYYRIYSSGSSDTYGELYDTGMNLLNYADYGGDNDNFGVYATLTAGTTYLLCVTSYSGDNSAFVVAAEVIHSYDYEVTTPSTCTDYGVGTYTCEHCGYSYTRSIYPSHTWGDVVTLQEPGCETRGSYQQPCTVCGYIDSWTSEANGHYCENGVCVNCGVDLFTDMPVLSLGVETAAEITTEGQYLYYKFVPEQTEYYRFYTTGSCDTYGYIYDENMNRLRSSNYGGDYPNFGISTEMTAGVTYVIGVRMNNETDTGSFVLMSEIVHNYEYVVTTPSTCTDYGVGTYTCRYCDDSYTEEIYPAHTWGDTQTIQEAGCETRGVEGVSCAYCDEVNSWYVEARGHLCNDGVCIYCGEDLFTDMPELTLDAAADVTLSSPDEFAYFKFTPSQTEYYRYYSTGYDDTIGYIYDSNMNKLSSNDGGYNYNNFAVYTELEAGTTYVLGVRLSDYDTSGSFQVAIAVAHSYNSTVTTEPTCTEAGVRTFICQYCDHSFTESIAPSHSWVTGAICEVCGVDMKDAALELEVGVMTDVVVENAGEVIYLQFTPTESEGYRLGSYCTNGDPVVYMYDSNMNQILRADDGFNDSSNFAAEYEMTAGETYFYAVRFYGSNVTGTIPVQLEVSHVYESEITTAVTCTEDGVLTYTCKHCDESYTEVLYAQHQFSNGYCSVCNMEKVTSGTCGENLTWELNEYGVLVIQGTGAMYDYETYAPWQALWPELYDVEIADGVTHIGAHAFDTCRYLNSVELPATVVSVGDYAFANCTYFYQVRFKGDAPAIADNAFYGVVAEALYPYGNSTWTSDVCKDYGGDLAWYDYSFTIAEGTINDSIWWSLNSRGWLNVYGETAMPDWDSAEDAPWYPYADQIRNVELYVTHVGSNAFNGYSYLSQVYVGYRVESVGEYAFANCDNLHYVSFDCAAPDIASNAFTGVTATCHYNGEYDGWVVTKLRNYGGTLTWDAMPHTVAYGNYGDIYWHLNSEGYMYLSGSNTDMNSQDSAAGYPWYAYRDQINHVSIYNVSSIGDYAFQGYENLHGVQIGETQSIGAKAFGDCSSLNSIYFEGKAPDSIAADAFENVEAYVSYSVDESSWTEDKMLDYGGTLTWNVREALVANGYLDGVYWYLGSDGVLVIYDETDSSMEDHEADTYPWKDYAEQITGIDIYTSRIGTYAFSNMTNVTSVQISGSVTEIAAGAFSGCTGLETITFTGNAPTIADDAFTGVTATAKHQGVNVDWTEDHHKNYGGSLTWTLYNYSVASGTYGDVEWSVTDRGYLYLEGEDAQMEEKTTAAAYPWSSYADQVKYVISSGVTNIGANAFSGFTSLMAFEIVDVEQIGSKAFAGCTAMTYGYLIGNAPAIAADAFTGVCANLYYPEYNSSWTASVLQNYGGELTWKQFSVYVETTVNYVNASISLDGNIGVNYYVELSEDIVADEGAFMEFTVAGTTQIVPISEAILQSDGTYRFACLVSAKQMGDVITAQMFTSRGAVGQEKTYSVKQYCDTLLEYIEANNPTGFDSLVTLVKAMLNYGAQAQLSFNYYTDSLVNADMSADDQALPASVDVSAYKHSISGSEEGVAIYGATLMLESMTTIRFYFQLTGDKTIDEYTFLVDGVQKTPSLYSGNIYYVDVPDVAAKDLDVMHTVTVGGLSVSYCGLSYANQVLSYAGSTETNINQVKALYVYNQAANAYFG